MELRDVYEIWDRFETSDLEEFVLDFYGVHLALKNNSGAEGGVPSEMAGRRQVVPKEIVPVTVEKNTNAKQEMSAGSGSDAAEVKAPLVGIFYRAPSPDSEPFAEVGRKVKKGDVIGIIEAMKLMNEVTANADGTVTEILAENGSFVEFDQPLIRIRQEK